MSTRDHLPPPWGFDRDDLCCDSSHRFCAPACPVFVQLMLFPRHQAFCTYPSGIALPVWDHPPDFRSLWILLLPLGTCRPSWVDVLCIPTFKYESLVKISSSPRSQQRAATHSVLFLPDTQRILFILRSYQMRSHYSSSFKSAFPQLAYKTILRPSNLQQCLPTYLLACQRRELGWFHVIYSW